MAARHPDRIFVAHQPGPCADRTRGWVSHVEHVLAFVVAGESKVDCGRPVSADSGCLVVIPAGVPHRPPSQLNCERWAVGFCASCLGLDEGQPLMAAFARVRAGMIPVLPVAKARRRRVVRMYRELQHECARGAPESAELSRAGLLLLLGEATRALPAAQPCTASSLTAGALEFIQKNALTPIALQDVAAAVHRSVHHVAATVKAETGHTVGEWITSARLCEAAALLLHSDASLEEITERVGWRDKTHLIRRFKRAYGETPAAWRRRQRAASSAR